MNIKNIETSIKAFIISHPERRNVFENFYGQLKKTLDSDVAISPSDALLLLVHHMFFSNILSEIMCGGKPLPQNEITKLLDETIQELKKHV